MRMMSQNRFLAAFLSKKLRIGTKPALVSFNSLMISGPSHKVLAAFLLTAVSLTSAGFTFVVGYCPMSQSSVCCCGTGHDKTHDSDGTASVQSQNGACFQERTVGGLNDTKATPASEYSAKQDQTYSFSVLALPTQSNTSLCSSVSNQFCAIHSPPAQNDIVISLHSFLI